VQLVNEDRSATAALSIVRLTAFAPGPHDDGSNSRIDLHRQVQKHGKRRRDGLRVIEVALKWNVVVRDTHVIAGFLSMAARS
jgi:hypothetical protein